MRRFQLFLPGAVRPPPPKGSVRPHRTWVAWLHLVSPPLRPSWGPAGQAAEAVSSSLSSPHPNNECCFERGISNQRRVGEQKVPGTPCTQEGTGLKDFPLGSCHRWGDLRGVQCFGQIKKALLTCAWQWSLNPQRLWLQQILQPCRLRGPVFSL